MVSILKVALYTESFITIKIVCEITGIGIMGQTAVQIVVPRGIESVNGSDVTMGCTSPLVDSSGVMVCSSNCSTLLDGISPTIDTIVPLTGHLS